MAIGTKSDDGELVENRTTVGASSSPEWVCRLGGPVPVSWMEGMEERRYDSAVQLGTRTHRPSGFRHFGNCNELI